VTEADLLLEFEIVAFDPPAQLGLIDHALQRDLGRQRGKPVMIRLGGALRRLNLLLQVRCAVYNGAFGSGFGHVFESISHPRLPIAAPFVPGLSSTRRDE
jgi:hypothetical protein